MNKDFLDEFISTRDDTLNEIKTSLYNWNKFITYWANILDKYSIDNVLNLYSYNSNGKTFMTFDEWNSEQIARRIKPKSKGIPILVDNKKIYVFDIKQTYGRDYNKWNYSHYVDNAILKYYQTELNVKNDNSKSFNENFYDIIYKTSLLKIVDDYKETTAEEVKFIAKTMASLFLSKSNFNIYTLPNVYEELNLMENEDILKCMQISNRETTILYNDFINDVNNLENIQNYIQTRILFLLKENGVISESEKQDIISGIDNNSVFNYDILENIYDNYYNKYEKSFNRKNEPFKPKNEKEKVIEDNLIEEHSSDNVKEQLSLFTPREEELANKICDIFNSFDTKYKNTFEVHNVELQRWEQIKSKKRNLSICITSPLAENFGEDSFTYFNEDKTDEKKLNDGIVNNYFLQQLYKDKDFSISFTPSIIHIFWHNFDDKQFDMNISSTKMINQDEIEQEELEKIDDEISNINNTKIEYRVTTAEIIPTYEEIKTNIIEEHNYDIDGKEIYSPINYHISDDKIDNTFGAKSRFEDNIKAIELLKKIENEDRNATVDEQEILSHYVGWGGIADAFDERKDNWKEEREKLKLLLNDEEYKAAAHSTLSSFYTPNVAIYGIYKTLKRFGFEKGNILEIILAYLIQRAGIIKKCAFAV